MAAPIRIEMKISLVDGVKGSLGMSMVVDG